MMSNYSPGGSRIYDHSENQPSVTNEVAHAPDGWRESIEAHLEKYFGECAGVFHEIISTNVHLDLYMYSPTEQRPYTTIVTVGASDQPLSTPEGAEIFQHIELFMHLPPDWPLPDGKDMADELYWPFKILKQIARFPHEYSTFLAYGHTVPNENPPVPYAKNTSFECALLCKPLFEDESFHHMEYKNKKLTMLQLVPITEIETEIKLELGYDALVDALLTQVKMQPALNIKRPCASEFIEFESSDNLDELYQMSIEETRELFQSKRHSLGFFEKRKFKPKAPAWVRGSQLKTIYDSVNLLRQEGQVVWGHIVQANSLLFDPHEKADCPAAAIYSLDPYYDGKVDELEEIASSLFEIKGEETTRELQQFSDILEDERTTQMKLPIPKSLTNGRAVIYTSIMVHRKQLPIPFLVTSAFPLLVHPNKTQATMILPEKYWSESMKSYWFTILKMQMEE
jgi:hypothetical protein